ncbi:MAG TPA: UDP-glucose 4-epimerase GalE [Chloroflexia bacterium]|nr:UDP-glucose 4-epimerase GalE [Chloroflexia bacterium]
MNILVTGGAGYIGSETVRALLRQQHRVTVLDSLEYGTAASLAVEAGLPPELVVGNILDRPLLDNLFKTHQIEAVIHFAAYKRGSESVRQPARYFLNNTAGTFNLLEAMVAHGIPNFIFSSSGSIFGNPAELPVSESTPASPENPYGLSKLLVEQALPWYEQAHGLKSISLRYFNAAGASPDGRYGEDWNLSHNLIPQVLKVALGKAPSFSVFGTDYPTRDGTAVRDFIHVSDLAEAHLKALEYLFKTGRSTVFNLGTGQGNTVREVIQAVKQLTGSDFRVYEQPRRPGEAAAIWADNQKARRELDWQPRYTLEDMVRHALQAANASIMPPAASSSSPASRATDG